MGLRVTQCVTNETITTTTLTQFCSTFKGYISHLIFHIHLIMSPSAVLRKTV